MRRMVAVWVLAAITATVPCQAEEPPDVSQQLAQLNRILVLMVRADVISQKLTLDQLELRELVSKRDELDSEIKEISRQNFSEAELLEMEKLAPERV